MEPAFRVWIQGGCSWTAPPFRITQHQGNHTEPMAVSLGKSFEHLKRVHDLQHTRLFQLNNVVSENETPRHAVP